MKLKVKIEATGGTTAGIPISEETLGKLGGGKRPAVRATINGTYTYRSTIGSMRGKAMLPTSNEVRQKAGVAAGDEIDLTLELDTEPREVAVPDDLARALAGSAKAKAFFEGLAPSHKKQYTLWIEGAKKAETREGRVKKALEMLEAGKKQG